MVLLNNIFKAVEIGRSESAENLTMNNKIPQSEKFLSLFKIYYNFSTRWTFWIIFSISPVVET